MSRYSAPTEDGKKHYVVTIHRWGRTTERVIAAEDAASARHRAVPRRGVMEYVVSTRRATPEDVAADAQRHPTDGGSNLISDLVRKGWT